MAAAVLAEAGLRVIVLEKGTFRENSDQMKWSVRAAQACERHLHGVHQPTHGRVGRTAQLTASRSASICLLVEHD